MATSGPDEKSIARVVNQGLCTGCGTCSVLCLADAIRMAVDHRKGVYLPQLDKERCNQCGICLDVCPGHSVNFRELNLAIFGQEPKDTLLGNYLACYIGHAADHEIRFNSASGGLVTALLVFALEKGIIDGALVTRMSDERPLEPRPFIARTADEIIAAAGSKYCPVPANIALREVLDKEGKYAVVGLPCHLHGVREAEMVNRELKNRIALHIGIFCSGVPNFTATDFLLHRLKVRKNEVEKLEYRGKGWPGQMSLMLKSGETKFIPYPAYWAEFGGFFFPTSCARCSDWFARLADISLGDAWLPELKQDNVGSSVIISRTTPGESILHQMAREGFTELSAVSGERIKESQGGFLQRRADFKAYLAISKLFNRQEVIAVDSPVLHLAFRNYMRSGVIYLMTLLSSRRSLWWLVDIFCSLFRRGKLIKSRLRPH